MKLVKIAETKFTDGGCCAQLLKSNKRYYRIYRTSKGNMYDVFVNNSEYGESQFDEPMFFKNRRVREWTIKECKESIQIYEMFE